MKISLMESLLKTEEYLIIELLVWELCFHFLVFQWLNYASNLVLQITSVSLYNYLITLSFLYTSLYNTQAHHLHPSSTHHSLASSTAFCWTLKLIFLKVPQSFFFKLPYLYFLFLNLTLIHNIKAQWITTIQ